MLGIGSERIGSVWIDFNYFHNILFCFCSLLVFISVYYYYFLVLDSVVAFLFGEHHRRSEQGIHSKANWHSDQATDCSPLEFDRLEYDYEINTKFRSSDQLTNNFGSLYHFATQSTSPNSKRDNPPRKVQRNADQISCCRLPTRQKCHLRTAARWLHPPGVLVVVALFSFVANCLLIFSIFFTKTNLWLSVRFFFWNSNGLSGKIRRDRFEGNYLDIS